MLRSSPRRTTHPDNSRKLDRRCDAFLTNHVANRASRLQGRAFLTSVARKSSARPHLAAIRRPVAISPRRFGAVTRASRSEPLNGAARCFFFNTLRGLVAAAVRLGIVGPMEAQALQHRLAPRAREISGQCEHLTVDDVAKTAPLLEIWQGTQDRLYSRLFQT